MELSIDREKVVKGLECCSHTDGINCCDCPYDNNNTDCTALMSMDVLDMLKDKKPKNVIAEKRMILSDDSYDELRYNEDTFYRCPSCNRILSRTHMNKNIHFCEECGQAVKWK